MPEDKSLAREGFLKSRGPLSALVAGAMVTSVTGALIKYFPLPGALTAIALSFLVGSLFLFDREVRRLPVRGVLFVFNSLTIFSVAVGLNTTGQETFQPTTKTYPMMLEDDAPEPRAPPEGGFFRDWF